MQKNNILKNKEKINVIAENGHRIDLTVNGQDSLARTIWLSGEIPAPSLCSGLGRCGNCRVLFHSPPPEALAEEHAILGDDAVAKGWRLACRHAASDGMVVELPAAADSLFSGLCLETVAEEPIGSRVDPVQGKLFLAVDLGTTSIQWQLFTAERAEESELAAPTALSSLSDASYRIVSAGHMTNPQMGAGSDILSRVAVAKTPEGRDRLRGLILRLLQRMVSETPGPIEEICVAGNTAMTAILLDHDVTGLAAAPYTVPERGGREARLPDLPPVWIPPQPAPFVGGDLSAGMAVLLYERREAFPFLLADMGTNGEFVLALDEQNAFVTSVPLGPSLEGMGLMHGGMAGPKSIVDFQLGPRGLSCSTPGGGMPEKICGTGYLSLLDNLLRCGFLTREGKPFESPASPLARNLARTLGRDPSGVWLLPLADNLCLSGVDVEELLKVKAAFSLALETLLQAAGLRSGEIVRFVLGGALGENAPTSALENLGFLPQGAGARTVAAGNTSLAGAKLLLLRRDLRERIIEWSKRCRVLDLMHRPTFTQDYMRHMFWG